MAEIITVWGSPHAGKTTFSVKLACAIYDTYQSTVLWFSPDLETPALPVLFPHEKAERLPSIGTALSGTEITEQAVTARIFSVRGRGNLGFLGFREGENAFTYPAFGEEKVRQFYTVLDSLCDCLIIDGPSNGLSAASHPLLREGMRRSKTIFRLASPTLSCLSFYASQLPLYADPVYRTGEHLPVLNVSDGDIALPADDMRAHLPGCVLTVPFCREVKQQMAEGHLTDPVHDKVFRRRMLEAAEKAVAV